MAFWYGFGSRDVWIGGFGWQNADPLFGLWFGRMMQFRFVPARMAIYFVPGDVRIVVFFWRVFGGALRCGGFRDWRWCWLRNWRRIGYGLSSGEDEF